MGYSEYPHKANGQRRSVTVERAKTTSRCATARDRLLSQFNQLFLARPLAKICMRMYTDLMNIQSRRGFLEKLDWRLYFGSVPADLSIWERMYRYRRNHKEEIGW